MSAFSIEVTEADFEEKVIEASKKVPVVIDLWAEWCGPCRVLAPVLARLANEYQGKFILAKIDADENMRIAGRYAVRGFPTVIGFVAGQEVERFSGAQTEGTVRKFLDRLLPSPADELCHAAMEVFGGGDTKNALRILQDALLLDMNHVVARINAADILLHTGQLREARETLEALPQDKRGDARVSTLLARLEFALQGEASPDAASLEAKIQVDANDLEARLQLANLRVSQEEYEAALALLLEIVQRDPHFGDEAGRTTMLSVFNLLGGEGELVNRYRKLLAAALH
jgi:putative thioredoxin